MKVQGPRVLIKKIDPPAKKSSILEIVEFQPEESQYGMVMAVGNGERLPNGNRRPIELNVGDVVFISKYASAPVNITVNGIPEELFMVMEQDVLAVVEL